MQGSLDVLLPSQIGKRLLLKYLDLMDDQPETASDVTTLVGTVTLANGTKAEVQLRITCDEMDFME